MTQSMPIFYKKSHQTQLNNLQNEIFEGNRHANCQVREYIKNLSRRSFPQSGLESIQDFGILAFFGVK